MNTNDLNKEHDGSTILKTLKHYEVLDTNHPNLEIIRIFDGAINRNFKVFDGNKSVLLKVFNNTNMLPINRRQVFDMQEELAILGLAPAPLFLSDDNALYCEQWIDAPKDKKLFDIQQKPMHLVNVLAEALYNIHSSYVTAPMLPLDEHWSLYWQNITRPSHGFQQRYSEMCKRWQHYVQKNKDRFVLCHNDLHADHISFLDGPIFDWEYAGLGCRYFDIASCCKTNNLSKADTILICESYANLANKEAKYVLHKVQETFSIVTFTHDLWAQYVDLNQNLQ
jgi:hypothetical protein